jgi:succinylglutamate desuccinylase
MNSPLLTQLDQLPDGFLTSHAQQLHSLLPHPTLIHLPGRTQKPLFISILLHGNEVTGLQAVQALLKKYQGQTLPRALSIFVGNISAARHNLRRLEGQPDYNRIWPGTLLEASSETIMAQQVVDEMSKRSPFASIDIHNNTGLNPHYACINKLGQPFFHLAALFSRTAVYFTNPKGVQSTAFAELCPSVTLECGKPDQKQGTEHALEFIEGCLHLSEHPQHPIAHNDIELFHTVAQVKVRENCSFSYQQSDVDLALDPDLDHMNFTELSPGTIMGKSRDSSQLPVTVHNDEGKEIASHFFKLKDNNLMIKRPLMPAMLTLDERVISQDCFCYLMERMPYNLIKAAP